MNKYNVVKCIASKVKKYCSINNISIHELSLRSELTYSTLHNIVSYKTKNINLTTIFHLCRGMNIKPQEFFKDIETNIL